MLTPELERIHLEEIHDCVGRMANAREDRDCAIQEAYRDGVPAAVIGKEAGLSRQRVHQIATAPMA